MHGLILLYGTTTIAVGIIMMISAETIFARLFVRLKSLSIFILAIFFRIILGMALVSFAQESKHPTLFITIGWIWIAGGIVLCQIGPKNFWRILSRAHSISNSMGRLFGILTILFGCFLVHAFG